MGETTTMRMDDGAEIAVYHVQPNGPRRGGLVLIQEIFGVTDHIREVADSYAADGYEVMAPALFDREHPGFEVGYDAPDFDRAIELAFKVHPFDQSVADVGTCVTAMRPRGPVFAVGYCYGGSVAWYAACRVEGLSAASAYYGSKVPESGEQPKVPTIAHFGRTDSGIPIDKVEALAANPPEHATIHVYEAGHGFNSDRRKDFDPDSAALARKRTLDLFAANAA